MWAGLLIRHFHLCYVSQRSENSFFFVVSEEGQKDPVLVNHLWEMLSATALLFWAIELYNQTLNHLFNVSFYS